MLDNVTRDVLVSEIEHAIEALQKAVKTLKESGTVFSISEDDVWAYIKEKGIKVPEDKREDVLRYLKKSLENLCFDGAYSVWNLIEDAVKEVLSEA